MKNALPPGCRSILFRPAVARGADGCEAYATLNLFELEDRPYAPLDPNYREIMEGISELAQHTGVFAEPAGAAVLSGLRSAFQSGLVDREERIVLLVTGTGLKDVSRASKAVAEPSPIMPNMEAVAQRWREIETG